MRRLQQVLSAALIAVMIVPAGVQAQTTLTWGDWFSFSWSGGEGPAFEKFVSPTNGVAVTDGFKAGDMFAVTVDGSFVGMTSMVPKDGDVTGASDGPTAWADDRLSKGIFSVTPGGEIGLNVIQNAEGFDGGTGFIRSVVVPEPGTSLLLLIGLLGLGLVGVTGRRNALAEV